MAFEPKREERKKCEERFAAGEPGDFIDAKSLGMILGVASGGAGTPGYSIGLRAAKACEKDHGLVWRWNRDRHGWECLDDPGKLGDVQRRRRWVRRQANRQLLVAGCTDVSKLDDKQRLEYGVQVAIAGVVATATSGPFRRRLVNYKSEVPLPSERLLLEAAKARLRANSK